MATLQYIGARYVPNFYLNSQGTPDWESGVAYEPLTIVTYNNNSYTSRKPVPAEIGNPSANTEYWAQTGVYNAQIGQLQNDVSDLQTDMHNAETDIAAIESKIAWYTPEMFGAVGDGVTDDSAAFQAMFDAAPHSAQIVCLNNYMIEHTVNITKNDIMFTGGFGKAEYTPCIYAPANLNPVFEVTGYGLDVEHLTFRSTGINNGTNFFDLNRDTLAGQGNIDASFYNCTFIYCHYCALVRGRNVTMESCIVTQATAGYKLYQMSIGGEHRGYIIRNTRFHSSWLGIDNTDGINNTLIKGILITGCYFDFALSIFRGYGGNVTITNNYFHSFGLMTGSGACIQILADNENSSHPINVIANNVIIGKGLTENLQARGIEIWSGKCLIKNNVIENFAKHGIKVFSSATCFTINNTFLGCATDSGESVIVYQSGSGGRITDNQCYYGGTAVDNAGSATESGTTT